MTVDRRELFAHHFAFLVGIDEYDHHNHDNLQGAYSDAKTLRDALRYVGYPDENLWLVPREKTGLQHLNDEIKMFLELPRKSRELDFNPDIIVFWAGHGGSW